MYAQAKRLYPLFAFVMMLILIVTGSAIYVTAKNEPEQAPRTTAAPTPAYTVKVVPQTKRTETNSYELAATKEPEAPAYLLDVPLDGELLEYIYDLCTERKVPYELIIAMIERESSYQSDVISKTNDYGLMQINVINHKTVSDVLGITDFLDPQQNCNAGIYIIEQLYRKYGDTHKALMAYNLGETGAKRSWKKGICSTAYSESVVEIMKRLETKGK